MNQPTLTQINQKLKRNHGIALSEKLQVYQAMSRNWRRHLSQSEIVALTYIVDRTVGWGKNHFAAAFQNVLHGNADFAGVGLPERTYFRALKSLQGKGLIDRRSHRDRTLIVLNIDWVPTNAKISPVFDLGEGDDSKACRADMPRSAVFDTPRVASVAAKECRSGTAGLPSRQSEYSS